MIRAHVIVFRDNGPRGGCHTFCSCPHVYSRYVCPAQRLQDMAATRCRRYVLLKIKGHGCCSMQEVCPALDFRTWLQLYVGGMYVLLKDTGHWGCYSMLEVCPALNYRTWLQLYIGGMSCPRLTSCYSVQEVCPAQDGHGHGCCSVLGVHMSCLSTSHQCRKNNIFPAKKQYFSIKNFFPPPKIVNRYLYRQKVNSNKKGYHFLQK